jgi:hypothetical protein
MAGKLHAVDILQAAWKPRQPDFAEQTVTWCSVLALRHHPQLH